MPRIAQLLLPLVVLIATSCQKASPPVAETAEAAGRGGSAPTGAPVGDSDAASEDDGITMRYDCEQGHSVALVRGEIARVSLADGRVVEIPRIAGSSPPRYSGVALSFDVGSDGATLGQHEVGGFACRAAD